MQLLLQVEFKDTFNNLDARRMLLKSYFELGEYNAWILYWIVFPAISIAKRNGLSSGELFEPDSFC